MIDRLKFWQGDDSPVACDRPATDYHLGGNATTVMSDFHICRYDAVLGVLVCVGDDVPVLILGKDACREVLPTQQGLHWLDCFVYQGTTSFFLLSPEVLLLMDYGGSPGGDSALHVADPTARFTCLHVPPGLTCGALGRRNGVVSYFRLMPTAQDRRARSKVVWTTRDVDILGLFQSFCKSPVIPDPTAEALGKFFAVGSVLSMDSYPDNPNAFIGIVAGVPGVCKWYVDEARASCFFSAETIANLPDGQLAVCKVTPGGTYVAATTMQSTKVLLWNESKKKRDKTAELYWVVDLSGSVSGGVPGSYDPFWYNEYKVGIHIARTALEDSFRSTNDKYSQMYLLIHGQSDIMEVVIRMDDKQVVKTEQIIAHLNAYTASAGVEAAKVKRTSRSGCTADDYFKVFHVEPCAVSNYWNSALTDVDLEALLITTADGLAPLLAKRNRQTGGVESISELRELPPKAQWYPRAMLIRLPEQQLRDLAAEVRKMPVVSVWEKLFRGGDPILAHALDPGDAPTPDPYSNLWSSTLLATVTDAGQALCLSPQTNETFNVNKRAVASCVPWSVLALGQDPSGLILEAALPDVAATNLPTEIILRVYTTESLLTVMKTDMRRNTGALVCDLDRAALNLEGPGVAGKNMVCHVRIVDARLEPSRVTSKMSIYKGGKSLLMLLEDASIALVNLSGAKHEGPRPYMLLVPSGLLPQGVQPISLDTMWVPCLGMQHGILALVILFGDGKGYLIWNLSSMRLIAYQQVPYTTKATTVHVTRAELPVLPHLSGEVKQFQVALACGEVVPSAAGEYGALVCVDALGGRLLTLTIGFGLVEGAPQQWCVQVQDTVEWVVAAGASPRELTLQFTQKNGTMVISSIAGNDEVSACGAPINTSGTTVSVEATWTAGRAELSFSTARGEMQSYHLNAVVANGGTISSIAPSLAFVSPKEITIVNVSSLFASTTTGCTPTPTPAVCRLDPSRSWEHVSICSARGALLIITRDANGWRWINLLDSTTAMPRMKPYATLDFAGEDHIQVLSVEVNGILHVYLLGPTTGVIGHLYMESNVGVATESGIVRRPCFAGRRYQSTPSSFRGYGCFIPPAPTLKQETGFFKRLMTLPWEDIALKVESETLRDIRDGSASSTQHVDPASALTSSAAKNISQPPPPLSAPSLCASSPQSKAAVKPLASPPPVAKASPMATKSSVSPMHSTAAQPPEPTGSRYAQLKAIAERENVSLTEARRMMSENVRKMQERGERLGQVESKSAELANQALTFQELARQLKEKRRSSWL